MSGPFCPVAEIIPSVNHPDTREVLRRLRLLEPHVEWAHVDVADGIFTSQKIFNDPSAFHNFSTPLKIEHHLMIAKPEDFLDAWMRTGARRLIVHYESTDRLQGVIERCRMSPSGVELTLALRPETPWEVLVPYFSVVRRVLILGVEPGPSGQEMQPHIIEKISTLKQNHSDVIIEVDGGVSIERGTARQAVAAGADILVAAREIFSSNDIPATVERFRRL